jgi:hypothetical protein
MKTILLALTSLPLLVGACANGPDPSPVSPRAEVLGAMTNVYEAGTVHEEFEMSVSAGGESFSFSGEGDVDSPNQRFRMSMDLGLLGGSMDMTMVDGVVYMRSPMFQDVSTEWVSMDPSKMDPGKAAQFGGMGGTMDPSAYAALLAGVIEVEAVGEQEIGGVATTRYAGTIDLGKVLERFPEVVDDVDPATKEQLEAAVEQLEALGLHDELPFEIWIDEDGFPRRQRFSMDFGSLIPGTEDARMEITVDLSRFGHELDIQAPPRSEVTDVTGLLAGASGASGVAS